MRHLYQEMTIGQLCRNGGGNVQTGPFGSQLKASAYVADGIPTIMPADLIDFRVSEKEIARIGAEDHKRLARHQLRPGDIVYGRRGDIGRHALITEREAGWLCGTGCLRIRFGNAPIEPRYISYYLRQSFVIDRILGMAVGSTMPNLNTSILESVPVLLPPLPIQRRIAEILGRLDDKIEVNRRINRTLEAMAQALYKHWFVDFGPFQDGEFVESELGLIPKGWKIMRLGEFFPVRTGKKNANASVKDGNFPFFTCSQDISRINVYSFDASAILLAGNGDFSIKFYRGKFDAYQRTYVLIPQTPLYLGILYHAMKYYLSEITAPHQGSVINYLTKDMIEGFPLSWPPKNVETTLVKRYETIVSTVELNTREIAKLTEIRDYLLPKLLTGEIPVEAAMAEV